MEVFDLISQGKAIEAQTLLNNEDYEIYKKEYAAGMSGLQNDLDAEKSSDIEEYERTVYIVGAGIVISILFLVFVWIRMISVLKQYRQTNEASQQKLVEEYDYNRMLFETSPIGLALTDMQGNLIDSNPAYHNIIGYTRDEIENLTYWDITPKDYEDQENQQLESLQKTGRYGPYEKEYIHKSGAKIPVLLNGLIINKNNTPYIWSTIEDISIRKDAEKALIEAKNRAEIANKEKTRFLANMSHELRTPMHAILSFSRLANRRVTDEKVSGFLDNIEKSGQRLTGLINSLLDLSKIEAGKTDVNYSQQNFYQIAQQCISHIDSLLHEKNLTLELESDELVEACLDPELITQVLINLLSNAIKYSPSPVPPALVSVLLLSVNFSKTDSSSSAGIPIPLSEIIHSTMPLKLVSGTASTLISLK